MSTGEITMPSESFDDHGDSTAVPEDLEGTDDSFEELEAFLVECDKLRAKWEKVDGADCLLIAGCAEAGIEFVIDGDDRRSLRVERRYIDRSS
jgi:hypothetical protein